MTERFSYSPPDQFKKREKDSNSNSDPESFSVTSDDSSHTLQSSNTQGSGNAVHPSRTVRCLVENYRRKM